MMADRSKEVRDVLASFFLSRQMQPDAGLQHSVDTKVNLFRDLAKEGHLSDDWIDYVADLIRRDMARRRGNKPNANWLRNTNIAEAVHLAMGLGLNATRNEATFGRASACSVVAEVLNMSEDNVRKIWTRHGGTLRRPAPARIVNP
jgi:hypothetical protein